MSHTNSYTETLRVDFLYWEDCPSHERALQLLREAIDEEGVDARVHIHRVESDEEAERIGFPGSPTIRVNGVDIDEQPGLAAGLTCRAYRHDNGRISPLPQKEWMIQAIRRARRAA